MFKPKLFVCLLAAFVFLFFAKTSHAQTCTPVFPATTCDVENNVTITATVPDTTITFSGFAPGSSVVYIKEGDFIVGSVVTASTGQFSKAVVSTPGSHTFVIYLTDNQGRTTPEVTLPPVSLSVHLDLPIANLHLPPTIAVSKTKANQSEVVTVSGQASPGATIDLYVNNIKRFSTLVGNTSTWQFDLNGGNFGDHNNFYAISRRTGLTDSEKSQVVSLEILACSDQRCNRIAEATPPSPSTPTTSANTNITYKIDLGEKLATLFPLISIFSGVSLLLILIIILLIFFLLRKRRKKNHGLLVELETKVQKDLTTTNPAASIHQDFTETEKQIND